MSTRKEKNKHVTILLNGGLADPESMAAVATLAAEYGLTMYLTTAQNLRLLGADEENLDAIKKRIADLGLQIKGPGKFPKPKVCVGMPWCNLAVADTFALAEKIRERYGDRTGVKPKYKIAISGCPACCGGSKIADIGIVATRKGFELYVGGKGGPLPRTGKRAAAGLTGEEVLEAVGRIADYHAASTPKKQRLFKLADNADFPYRVEP
ncbi:MAG: NAD(P)/FAD-dependent oxidoreductase [Desulfobulbaceae bacterium]